jgi:hypothetical protein
MTDHPDIVNCERYGYPDGPRKRPICPVCGEECDTYYRDNTYRIDRHGEILGCENCIDELDAWYEMED